MTRKHLILAFAIGLTLQAAAQGAAIDLGHRGSDSLRVTNLSVGLMGGTDSLKGVQLNILANIAHSMNGVQLAGFSNVATSPFKGLQLSPFTNIAMGMERGLQLSSMLNVSSGYMRGAQLGVYNYADSLNGSQLGIVNVALSHPRGWQLGIVNISRDTVGHKVGLVNVSPRTTIDFMVFAGSSLKLNGAMRFRNRSTYNIIGMGSHFMGLDKKFSGALFYRIGQYFPLNERLSLSGDVGYAHIETFEQHSQNKPERLFSLQARLNLDYQLSPRLGAFLSVGYGDTRYYHHFSHYRSRPLLEAGLTLRGRGISPKASPAPSKGGEYSAALACDKLSPPFGGAGGGFSPALEVTGINAFVHLFDRFVLAEDFAKTNLHTWHHNFKNGFVWDNDQFSTNLFAHPYHGNLYFNAARSQGLSFWQSAPYAVGGSLMWEFLGEIEPPAINDLIATSMGGICIGEVTHRISDLVLNDRSRGFRRFLREATATIIDPMKGLNRILSGKAWKVKGGSSNAAQEGRYPVDFSITAGNRYLADDGALFRGEHNPYVNLYLEYGDPLNSDGGQGKPYDFFDAEVAFGMSSNQPLINQLRLLGRLWSAPMFEGRQLRAEVGFYQHFNYYDSKPVKDGTSLTPYRISEAASVGPGIIFQMPQVGSLSRLEQRFFLSGILLGGTKSDYYNIIDRDYNMGSGFSLKSKTHMEMRGFGRFILHAQYYHLYTWKGYENKDLSTVDPLYLNAQGDRGNAGLLVVNPILEIDLDRKWSLSTHAAYYIRNTHYKYYDDVHAQTFELRAGLTCHF